MYKNAYTIKFRKIQVHEEYIKSPESRKFSYFRQLDVYETLAIAVFDYADSKFESWHRAMKIRDVNSVNKSTSSLLVLKNKIVFIFAAN